MIPLSFYIPKLIKNMKNIIYTVLLCFPLASLSAQSNLFVDTTITPQQMVTDFFNTGQVTVSNVQFTGAAGAAAFFDASNTDLDLLAGLMLSSGRCADAANPAYYFASTNNDTDGDSDLNDENQNLFPTFDAAALEFDLVSQTDTLCFIYRFGSEEYPEYVCSSFNDIFAFFVEGPGYSGKTNIALVPGDTLPVAINNVNSGNGINPCPPVHNEFYVPYDTLMGEDAAYDGFTTTLPAKFVVQPGETYHVKLAIADAGDPIFDSGVFIAINSLGGDSLLTPVAGMTVPAVDGYTVTFVNECRYGTSWFWDFGDGTTSNERNPGPHTYPQFGPGGDERTSYDVTLIASNYCCSDTVKTTVALGSSGVHDTAAAAFKLSPNPATDWLDVAPADASEFSIRVFNAAGQAVRQMSSAGVARVHIGDLAPGMYTCEVAQGKSVTQQRFVKR